MAHPATGHAGMLGAIFLHVSRERLFCVVTFSQKIYFLSINYNTKYSMICQWFFVAKQKITNHRPPGEHKYGRNVPGFRLNIHPVFSLETPCLCRLYRIPTASRRPLFTIHAAPLMPVNIFLTIMLHFQFAPVFSMYFHHPSSSVRIRFKTRFSIRETCTCDTPMAQAISDCVLSWK